MSKTFRLTPVYAEALKGPAAQAVENARGQVSLWKSRLEAAEKELVAAEAVLAPLLASVAAAHGLDSSTVRVVKHTEGDKQRALSNMRQCEAVCALQRHEKDRVVELRDEAKKALAAVDPKDAKALAEAEARVGNCEAEVTAAGLSLATAEFEAEGTKARHDAIVVGAVDLVVD